MIVIEQRALEAVISMSESFRAIAKELHELNEKIDRVSIDLGGVECVEREK